MPRTLSRSWYAINLDEETLASAPTKNEVLRVLVDLLDQPVHPRRLRAGVYLVETQGSLSGAVIGQTIFVRSTATDTT